MSGNLFALQSLIKAELIKAVGSAAEILTAYDLEMAGRNLSAEPAIYILPARMRQIERHKGSAVLIVEQQWEVTISAAVALHDKGGDEAMALIGGLAYEVVKALNKAIFPSVKDFELNSMETRIGLVGNKLVIPLNFTATIVQTLL